MLQIQNLSQLNINIDNDILDLLKLRQAQLDPDIHVSMYIIEPGDDVVAIEDETGCCLLSDVFGQCRYPDPDFVPSCEVLEDHGTFYVMLYVFDDDGIEIIIPKRGGDPVLLSMCETFAVWPV